MEINGKTVLVTGGGSGLGAGAVARCAQSGAQVAVLDRSRQDAEEVSARVADPTAAFEADVADTDAVAEAIAQVIERYGTIDVLVNAAGVAPAGKTVSRGKALELAEFRQAIDVNLIGMFDVTRQAAAHMINNQPDADGERGVVVNVSSGAAWAGGKGQAAYSASKAGVIGMMLPIARDLAPHGIRVCTIAPGPFETAMASGFSDEVRAGMQASVLFPQRLGTPEDFAGLVAHVVENPFINATTLSIDGGCR